MSNFTIVQIKDSLKSIMATMTVANGYSIDILSSNIYDVFNPQITGRQRDTDYPKVFILVDSGKNMNRPSERVEKILRLTVIIVIKRQNQEGEEEPQVRIQNIIDDFHRLIQNNSTLNNKVEICEVDDYTTDSGFAEPEGVAVFTLSCLYFHDYL